MSSTQFDDPPAQDVRDAAASDLQGDLAPPSPLNLGSPRSPRQHVSSSLCCLLWGFSVRTKLARLARR